MAMATLGMWEILGPVKEIGHGLFSGFCALTQKGAERSGVHYAEQWHIGNH